MFSSLFGSATSSPLLGFNWVGIVAYGMQVNFQKGIIVEISCTERERMSATIYCQQLSNQKSEIWINGEIPVGIFDCWISTFFIEDLILWAPPIRQFRFKSKQKDKKNKIKGLIYRITRRNFSCSSITSRLFRAKYEVSTGEYESQSVV